MNLLRTFLACLMILGATGSARADLIGLDILVQGNAGGTQLITGWYDDGDNSRGQPQRVFGASLTGSFDGDEPGVRAVSTSIPLGMTALPGSKPLHIDLLPMTIGMTSSNLFYWNGTGPVNFTNVSAGYQLEVSGTGGFSVTADGTPMSKTDTDPFVTTGVSGTIHKHPDYVLSNGGTPDEGVYLVSMGLRMPGTSLADAEPIFVLLATSTISDATNEMAAQWVNDNVAAVPEPSSMLLAGASVGAFLLKVRRRRQTA